MSPEQEISKCPDQSVRERVRRRLGSWFSDILYIGERVNEIGAQAFVFLLDPGTPDSVQFWVYTEREEKKKKVGLKK